MKQDRAVDHQKATPVDFSKVRKKSELLPKERPAPARTGTGHPLKDLIRRTKLKLKRKRK